MSSIRVLGLDGGSRNTGLAIIDYSIEERSAICVDATHFVSTGATIPEQLDSIAQHLKNYIDTYNPSVFSYESVVFKGRAASGNGVGIQQALGVTRLVCYKKGLQEFSYTPRHIKLATTGNSKADKEEIIALVARVFPEQQIKKSHNHAADAVAIALTYLVDQHKYKICP